MKKRIAVAAALILAVSFILPSCSAPNLIASVDSLLTPPLYYSEYEGLVKAFNSSVETGVVLCNPTQGDHLSAITVSDVDGDGEEEGIVFYRDTLQENAAHFSVFKCTDDVWSKKCDFKGYGNEVSSLTLTDLDADGTDEIVTIWTYSGIDSGSVFSVCSAKDSSLNYEELLYESCEIAKTVDLDGNGSDEIFYIASSKSDSGIIRSAEVIGIENGKISRKGTAPADSQVISYSSFKAEKNDEHSPMKVYVDALKSNNMMITEVFYFDEESGNLINPFYDEETRENTLTLRYEQIPCADINNDGMIEIPVQTVYEKPEDEGDETLYITEWIYFEGSNPVLSVSTFVNLEDGYLVNLGTLGNRKLYIRKHKGGDWASWSVYTKSSTSVFGNVLFTIIKVPRTRWETDMLDSGQYITILKQLDSVVCVNINENGRFAGLDEAKIRKIVTRLPS